MGIVSHRTLPDTFTAEVRRVLSWAEPSLLIGLLLTVSGLVALWVFVPRLPRDYFARPPRARSRGNKIIRWLLGTLLVVAGVAMLILPGPGVVALVLGLVVLDLPVFRRMALALLRRPKIAASVNNLRKKRGRPPFDLPAHGH